MAGKMMTSGWNEGPFGTASICIIIRIMGYQLTIKLLTVGYEWDSIAEQHHYYSINIMSIHPKLSSAVSLAFST